LDGERGAVCADTKKSPEHTRPRLIIIFFIEKNEGN
jgi:hypothetical protein